MKIKEENQILEKIREHSYLYLKKYKEIGQTLIVSPYYYDEILKVVQNETSNRNRAKGHEGIVIPGDNIPMPMNLVGMKIYGLQIIKTSRPDVFDVY
jgi:hypothetical protein